MGGGREREVRRERSQLPIWPEVGLLVSTLKMPAVVFAIVRVGLGPCLLENQ